MSEQANYLYTPINSIIGEGASFNGEFSLEGSLRIDGNFHGKISSEGKVVVGQNGQVETNIKARIIVISGKVTGNIHAKESVHLLSTAKIYGDIISPNLVMEEGVFLEGRVSIK